MSTQFKTFTTSAPTTTATQCLAANPNRTQAIIANNGTQTVFLGKDNTLTTANGIPLGAGSALRDDITNDAWWAITASGTGDLRICEVA